MVAVGAAAVTLGSLGRSRSFCLRMREGAEAAAEVAAAEMAAAEKAKAAEAMVEEAVATEAEGKAEVEVGTVKAMAVALEPPQFPQL